MHVPRGRIAVSAMSAGHDIEDALGKKVATRKEIHMRQNTGKSLRNAHQTLTFRVLSKNGQSRIRKESCMAPLQDGFAEVRDTSTTVMQDFEFEKNVCEAGEGSSNQSAATRIFYAFTCVFQRFPAFPCIFMHFHALLAQAPLEHPTSRQAQAPLPEVVMRCLGQINISKELHIIFLPNMLVTVACDLLPFVSGRTIWSLGIPRQGLSEGHRRHNSVD